MLSGIIKIIIYRYISEFFLGALITHNLLESLDNTARTVSIMP